MEGQSLLKSEMVGRLNELGLLSQAFERSVAGSGSTYLVSGEAGIGKTRLVSEIMSVAESDGATLIRGWCLPECLEPLMPVKEALREGGMQELVAGTPPPKILSGYLMNDAGMLFARAERTKSNMDADIFAAMLKAVSSFVSDSLRMMGQSSGIGEFSSISHSGYRILVQSRGKFSLAMVIEGAENEFLIDDMDRILAEVGEKIRPDIVDVSQCGWAEEKLMKLVTSARYDGAFVMDDPRLRQENLFDNILLGLQRASALKPLVLFLDDLQWADPSTLGLLHYLSRNTRSGKVFILGTYRPEDIVPRPDGTPHTLETTLQNMSRESLFTEIRLKRLGKDGTQGIVAGSLGPAEFSEELYAKIHTETDGNPFFVLEILRLLVDEGFVRRSGDIWVMEKPLSEMHLPSKIFDVIQRRLNRLLKTQYEILECASVVGERFGSDVVGQTLDMNRMSLLKNLNEIEKIHKLIHSSESKYHFDHCKIRDVLYGSIGNELRIEYHRAVAQSYEKLFEGREKDIAGELAHHFLEAKDPRAAKYLVIAGDRARKEYANGEAIVFYNHALEIVKLPEEIVRINEWLGDLYTLVGDCERAIVGYSNAIEIAEETVRKADLYRKMAHAFEKHSEYESGITAAQTGLEILGDCDDPVRCRLLTTMSLNHVRKGEYDKALELLGRAMVDATRLNVKKEIADAHRLMGITWWFRGNFEKALEHYQDALIIQRKIGDDSGKESTLNNIGVVYMETGRLDEALEYFMEGLEYGEMVGDKSGTASTIDNIGNLLHSRGDVEKALEYHLRGLELYRMTGDRNGVAWALSSLGYVYPDLEQNQRGIDCQLESVEICKEIGDQHILAYNYYGLADVHTKMEQFDAALNYANMALELSRELGAKREEGASTYVLGTIHRDMGEFPLAMDTYEQARELLSDVGDTSLLSMIDYDTGLCLKMMGETEEAKKLLEKALGEFRKMGMGIWLRKTEAALADLKGA
ncbi:MAG: tetratricopeptide repeat protein [Candidatus Thermoplasmatota archaeon]|nr:tetratricopeptide repeat protein [Candidatus Thermoplasmatota archaeon]MBU4071458.1 tetratricopeptide repeat protein [Candidatus Thermoplasmatota archaeon]MBU4144438.1 tetratricopeptide repeat protein [Candidatus Thermoplasmatota archaeon]MBU4592330.1 tetratricopeptide repeat protein [Candidatus Thermoplasmatota archaeon]